MPYDDPSLKQFENYYLSHKPSERERAENWAIAIGLQKVDGLTPSKHLISVAKNPHYGIYTDLYKSITTGTSPIADGRSGYLAVDMVLGFYRSVLKKNEIELPLPNEFKIEEMAKLDL